MDSARRRRRDIHIFSWTGALLLLGVVAAVNFVAGYFPIRVDTSEGGIYSISRGTKDILRQLDDTLLIKVVFSKGLPPQFRLSQTYVDDLLIEYRRASRGRIRIEHLDPGSSDAARQEAMSLGVAPVQVDVRERDRREVREGFMGVALLFGDRREAIPFIQDTQGLEYEITQRIKRLVAPELPRIGFVTDGAALGVEHEELAPLRPAFDQAYDARDVDLFEEIPDDLKALWVIGPTEPLDEEAFARLRGWVARGGTLALLLDRYDVDIEQFRTTANTSAWDDFLRAWGVGLKRGLVLDARSDRIQIRQVQGFFQMINLVEYPHFPLVVDVDRTNPALRDVDAFTLPFVSAVEIRNPQEGLSYRALARSSEHSWVDANPFSVSPLERRARAPGAETGPFDLAMVIDGLFDPAAEDAKEGRVILFGSSRFVWAQYPTRPANRGVFLNLLDWSAQDEALLSIRAKGAAVRPLKRLPDGVRVAVKYAMMAGLPVLTLLIGLFVWRRQRAKRAMLPFLYREAL